MIPIEPPAQNIRFQRVLIFGAGGQTGRHLLEQGLARGWAITAFVRHPEMLKIRHPKLTTFPGDVLNIHQVNEAVRNHDAVISVLGNPTRQAIRGRISNVSEGTKNIISGMKSAGVRRLVFVTAFGVTTHMFWGEKLVIRMFLKNLFADIPDQEKQIKTSGLDWTIVRPARLTNGPRTGHYHSSETLYIQPFSHVSRADLADFLLNTINAPGTIRQTLTVSA